VLFRSANLLVKVSGTTALARTVFVGEIVEMILPSLNKIDELIEEKLLRMAVVFGSSFIIYSFRIGDQFFFLPPSALGSAVAAAPTDARSASEPPKI